MSPKLHFYLIKQDYATCGVGAKCRTLSRILRPTKEGRIELVACSEEPGESSTAVKSAHQQNRLHTFAVR